MTEPTLSLTWDSLLDEVTEYVYGGDGDYTNLSSAKQSRVNKIVAQGLRQFYDPPLVNGYRHHWSFLYPQTTLTLNAPYSTGTITYDHTGGANELEVTLASGTWPSWAANGVIEIDGIDYPVDTRVSDSIITLESADNPGADVAAGTTYSLSQNDYQLPDNFGHLWGAPTYAQKEQAFHELTIVPEQKIRALRQRDSNVNYASQEPFLAAIRPKARSAETNNQLQEIIFWPNVTDDVTVYYRYRVRPDNLSSASGYAYGASDHSETILASCLAAAEERMDETSDVFMNRFMRQLASSVELDGKVSRGELIGMNLDRSDDYPVTSALKRHVYLGDYNNVVYTGTGTLM